MFARLGTDYEVRNQWFFAIWGAMATDSDLFHSGSVMTNKAKAFSFCFFRRFLPHISVRTYSQ